MRIKSVAVVLYERFSMILKTYISRTDKKRPYTHVQTANATFVS